MFFTERERAEVKSVDKNTDSRTPNLWLRPGLLLPNISVQLGKTSGFSLLIHKLSMNVCC